MALKGILVKQAYRDFLNTKAGLEAYSEFKALVYGRDQSLVQFLNSSLDDLAVLGCSNREFSVCDIGGGDGLRTLKVIGLLRQRVPAVFRVDIVEQSELYIRKIKALGRVSQCHVTALPGLIEQVPLPLSHYDLVMLIHSIFALDYPSAMDKIMSLKRADGKVVFVSNGPDSFFSGLKQIVDCDYPDRRVEIGDVQLFLKERAEPFRSISFETTWSIGMNDFDRCLRIIVDWICLGRYKSLCSAKRDEVRDYFYGRGVIRGGELIFVEEEVIVVA